MALRDAETRQKSGVYEFGNLDAFERQFVRKLCNNLEMLSLLYFQLK